MQMVPNCVCANFVAGVRGIQGRTYIIAHRIHSLPISLNPCRRHHVTVSSRMGVLKGLLRKWSSERSSLGDNLQVWATALCWHAFCSRLPMSSALIGKYLQNRAISSGYSLLAISLEMPLYGLKCTTLSTNSRLPLRAFSLFMFRSLTHAPNVHPQMPRVHVHLLLTDIWPIDLVCQQARWEGR